MADADLLHAVRPTFRAIARTVVPESAQLTERAWQEVESIVASALADRPPRVRRQVLALIRLIEWMPLVRYGRPFSRLDMRRRTAVLTALQDGRTLLLRRGVWGLRTLVFMGYYARPEVDEHIGYRASARGWLARGDVRVPLPAVSPAKEVGPLGGPLTESGPEHLSGDYRRAPDDDPSIEVSP